MKVDPSRYADADKYLPAPSQPARSSAGVRMPNTRGKGPFPKGIPVTLTKDIFSQGEVLFHAGQEVWIMPGYENGRYVPVTDGWNHIVVPKSTL